MLIGRMYPRNLPQKDVMRPRLNRWAFLAVALQDKRRSLVPQDPVVPAGTLRDDPPSGLLTDQAGNVLTTANGEPIQALE